jgi:predicted transglutaminase-like cysteine proteinase
MSGRLLTTLFGLLCLLTPAQASSRLAAIEEAPALVAWTEFCERTPAECAVDISQPDTIVITDETRELIVAVNRHVNRTIKAVKDIKHWGKVDQWDIPTDGRGDCEDYQLLKRKLLAEAGLPRRAMRMTVVLDQHGDGHAVLTIRTPDADLILDNLTDAVLPWRETSYRFLKRESTEKIGWAYLDLEPSPARVALAAAQ